MSHERESERGGAFTRRNFLYSAASTAALSLSLESPPAGGTPPAARQRRTGARGGDPTHQPPVLSAEHRLTHDAAGRDSRSRRPHGRNERLRPWSMRSMHRASGRPPRPRVPDVCSHERRARGHYRGSERAGCAIASHATGVHRSRRVPVRLLHARTDHVGDRVHPGGPRRRRAPDSRIYERQYLSCAAYPNIVAAIEQARTAS